MWIPGENFCTILSAKRDHDYAEETTSPKYSTGFPETYIPKWTFSVLVVNTYHISISSFSTSFDSNQTSLATFRPSLRHISVLTPTQLHTLKQTCYLSVAHQRLKVQSVRFVISAHHKMQTRSRYATQIGATAF